MKYQGGKTRVSKDIVAVIKRYFDTHTHTHTPDCLVSLFCGSCAVEFKLTDTFNRIVCNDIHEYLISMFKVLQNDYELPDEVSYELWDYVRNHKDEDKALTGFVGFGSSFGGRFFQGYARNNQGRNYAKETKNSLVAVMDQIKQVEFSCMDYKSVILPEKCVVYCDPPYEGTKSYAYQGKFDSNEFWDYMREISKNHVVFISEQHAPDDFVSIWEKPLKMTLAKDAENYKNRVEHLYVHECNA